MRTRRLFSAVATAGVLLLSAVPGWAGEKSEEWTRDDLVATLERSPGPAKGSANAPVVMVYFTDFQCGYCRKFVVETLPRIDTEYVQAGKVRLVFRHLAILGQASVRAARAASCAFDQGKFWEYHDALFASKSSFAMGAASLKRHAKELGLDEQVFETCMDGPMSGKRVEAETLIGRALGATGTPAFLINGRLALGAHPFSAFQRSFDALLATPGGNPAR